MLIYSKDRLVPTEVNMMVIRAKDGDGYFYIHRSLYDQAVIINDIYGDEPEQLIKEITGSTESRPDVDFFLNNMPIPINILGPFLLLVKSELTEFEDMVGAIHVMSRPLSFRGMLKIPFEMRNMNPSFSLSIKEEYKIAWDEFFQFAMPYGASMTVPTSQARPMAGTAQTYDSVDELVNASDAPQELTGYEDQGIDADALAFLMGDGDDPFAELDDMDEEESDPFAGLEETKEDPAPIPVPEPEPEPEPEPVAPAKSGVDALLDL